MRHENHGDASCSPCLASKQGYPFSLIASATDRQLAKYIQYLKEENKILRARIPGQIHTTKSERKRLLRFGKPIGRAIKELITIVTPSTFYRWVRDEKKTKKPERPKGGQRKPKELRELVLMIARETGFGYSRIIGELRKLGIRKISRQTVRNILKEEGIEPGPERSTDTWKDFLNRHGETLWGCDFFSVKTVTKRGLREMYVLVFLCQQTRVAIVSSATEHPNSAWVVEQTKAFLDQTADRDTKHKVILHDRDKKFTKQFTETLTNAGVKTNPLPKASPNLNGRCERIIGSIKWECLDRFVIFGKRHLDFLLKEFVAYYNDTRCHVEREHLPPIRSAPEEVDTISMEQVIVQSHVGGLVKSFATRTAA